jgi:hypothetical protein
MKIKTFEAACKALKIKATVPTFEEAPEKHRKAMLAHFKLVLITEALNEGWKPNWNNFNEDKYYQWWDMQNGFPPRELRLLGFQRVFPSLLQK